jgi:4-amino-4-deoxy-L-arabinose transferase-like glycosyltransferase
MSTRPTAGESRTSGHPTLRRSRFDTRFWLLAIVVFAFAVRLALVMHAGERTLVNDETGYHNIASHVVAGHGYQVGTTDARRHPTAARGPSYVLYLAAFYKVAGPRTVPPLVGQCVLEALACLLAFRIAWRLFSSRGAGLVAAALYAVYPPFIINSTQMITETFTNVTFLAAIAAFLEYVVRHRTRDLVFTGLALGLCALNKPHAAPIAVLLPFVALPALGRKQAIRSAVVVTIVTASVMAPWVVRNAVVFHRFIPGVTQVGFTFWGGTAPVGGGRLIGSLSDPAVPDSVRQVLAGIDGEIEQSDWFTRDAFRVIASDPWAYAVLCVRKIPQLWLNIGFDEPPSRASLALAAFNLAAFALAVLALWSVHPRPLAARLLLVLGVFWTLAHLPATTLVRYAMPYYALLFCYTGAGIDYLWRRTVAR